MINFNKQIKIKNNSFSRLSSKMKINNQKYNKKTYSIKKQRSNIIIFKNNMMNCKMNK